MTFRLQASLRRLKPQRRSASLQRRDDGRLDIVDVVAAVGGELMFDTSVYVDTVQGRAPAGVDRLLDRRILNHSSVALMELTYLFGRLDPEHPSTRTVLDELRGVIDDIPSHRLSAPSTTAFGEAGMLAGLVSRLTGRPHSQSLLNDALLLCHAMEQGCVLLTGNIEDFDCLQQIVPSARVLFYRRLDGRAAGSASI